MERTNSLSSLNTVVNTSPIKSFKRRALGSLRLSLPKVVIHLFDQHREDTGREDNMGSESPSSDHEDHDGSPRTPLKSSKSWFGSIRSGRASATPPTNSNSGTRRYRGRVNNTSQSLRDKFRRSSTRDGIELEKYHSSPITIPEAARDVNPLHRAVPSDLTDRSENPLQRRMRHSLERNQPEKLSKSISPCPPGLQTASPMSGATFPIEDIDGPQVPFEQAFDNMSRAKRLPTKVDFLKGCKPATGPSEPNKSSATTHDPFIDSNDGNMNKNNDNNDESTSLPRARSETFDSGYASASDSRQAELPTNMIIQVPSPRVRRMNSESVTTTLSQLPVVVSPVLVELEFSNPSPSNRLGQSIRSVTHSDSGNSEDGTDKDSAKGVDPTRSDFAYRFTAHDQDALLVPKRRAAANAEKADAPKGPPSRSARQNVEDMEDPTHQSNSRLNSSRHVYEGTFFGSRTERPVRIRHTFASSLRIRSLENYDVPFCPRSMVIEPPAYQESQTLDGTSERGYEPIEPLVPLRYWKRPRDLSENSWPSSTTLDTNDAIYQGYEDGGPLERTWRLPSPVTCSDDSSTNMSID